MAAPQGGYPPQGYPQQEGYSHEQSQAYDGQPSVSPTQANAPAQGLGSAAAGRKKRAYAGQAYEFGVGANSALGGQQQAGGAHGGYPQQPQQQNQSGYPQAPYGADQAQAQNMPPAPIYGQSDAANVGGYQPPAPTYPSHGAGPALGGGGVGGMTQQFGQMGMGEKPMIAPQQPQMQQGQRLNALYPTDLLNQPFNVAELDYPPPPVILPPNVSL